MQEKSSLHLAAIAYAECGIPVFPCEVHGKRPATPNGFHDATTDSDKINAWWTTADYNLAFSPGMVGLTVVDLDPHAKPSGALPPTYTVKTPRGQHLYYLGEASSSASKIGEHVDTRGIGGYVLAPPSRVLGRNLTGCPEANWEKLFHYEAVVHMDYTPLPHWIPERLKAVDTPLKATITILDLPQNIERARKLLSRYVEQDDVAVEGMGGDYRTYQVCCELLDLGLSPIAAQEVLEDVWNPACMPPWSSEELEQKLYNASQYQQNEAGAYGVDKAVDVFGGVVGELLKESKANVKLSRFYFKDESEMDDEPDPKWLVKDLISERSTVMMYGKSGSYKSFLAMELCLAIATGKQTFGSDTTPGLVFYGALEGKAHLKKARRAWRILRGIEGKIENFFVGAAPMIAVGGEMQAFGDEIAKRCAGRKPTLIVIDTLSKAMAGLNENDAGDAGKFIQFCDSLVEAFGCTVLIIHHQSDKEGSRGARGSSAFFAGFDTVLEVEAYKPTKAVAVHVRKHKDAEEREAPWTFEGRVTGPSLTFQPTTLEQHKLLSGETKDLMPKSVGAALRALSAFGEEAGVTTAVLATQLTPTREDESVEKRSEAIARTGRALSAASTKSLEGYAVKKGKAVMWLLPAPNKD